MSMNYCQLLDTAIDRRRPSEFIPTHHVHILVRKGEMRFSDRCRSFLSKKDDLVVWQMSNTIRNVVYSTDFEADFLVVTGEFLSQYNPEMVWASKGFVFIRTCPSFHLDNESLRLIKDDFGLFRCRQVLGSPFRREVSGRVLQIFHYDLWTVYQHGLAAMEASDRSAQLFVRFLGLLQTHVRTTSTTHLRVISSAIVSAKALG